MSRVIREDDPLFRAVITETHPATADRAERVYTYCRGPYTAPGPARAAITSVKKREARGAESRRYRAACRGLDSNGNPVSVTGHVEVIRTPTWERVE